ncbi:MAG: hypothetical protein AAB152_09960 [Candidatus Coatesbacteria bacterium]
MFLKGWWIPRRILFPLTVLCGLAVLALALVAQPDARALQDAVTLVPRAWFKNWAGWGGLGRALPVHGRAALAAAAILAAAWCAGGRILRWLGGRERPIDGRERLLSRIGLGLGGWAVAVMGLALAGLMTPVVLAALGVVMVAMKVPAGGRGGEAGGARGLSVLLWALSGVILLTDLAASLCPEWFSDGQMYHLGLPERLLFERKFFPCPENLLTFLPLNTEMIYGVALAFGGEEAAKLLNWCWGGLLALAAAALAGRLAGTKAAAWTAALAAFLFVSLPVTMVENEISFGDNLRALMETVALIWAIRAVRGSRAALAVAAVFAGIAMGSKYLSVIRGGLLALGLLVIGVAGTKGRSRVQPAIWFVAVASLVVAPWLARNWYLGGDPVYPFLQGIFTPIRFTAADLARWMQDNTHYGVTGQTLRGWAGILYRASVAPGDTEFGTFALSPLLLGLLPLVVVRRRWSPGGALVLGVIAGEWLAWSLSSHLIRYLLPALAATCGLYGWLIGRVEEESPRFARVLMGVAILWFLPVLVMRAHHRFNLDDRFGAFEYTFGRTPYTDRLGARGFGAVLKDMPAGTVLLVGEDRVLGLGRRWRAGSIYDRMLVKEWAEDSGSLRRFEVKTRQAGVRAVILYGDGFRASQDRGPGFRLTDRELGVVNPWWKRLGVVYRHQGWTGYAITGVRNR